MTAMPTKTTSDILSSFQCPGSGSHSFGAGYSYWGSNVSKADRHRRRQKPESPKSSKNRHSLSEITNQLSNPEASCEFSSPGERAPDFTPTTGPLILVTHRDVVFEDRVVYLTGNTFDNCTFKRCTLIYIGFPMTVVNCHIDNSCSFHIDTVLHDATQARDFIRLLTGWLKHMPNSHDMFTPNGTRGTFDAASIAISPVLPCEPSSCSNDEGSSEGKI
jgi:hypothetical protein